MKQVIQLSESEIKLALIAYVGTQGVDLEGKTTDITFNAGRKGNGHTAEIEVVDGLDASAAKSVAKKTKATKKVEEAVEEETSEEVDEVAEEVETETAEVEDEPKSGKSLFN